MWTGRRLLLTCSEPRFQQHEAGRDSAVKKQATRSYIEAHGGTCHSITVD